MNYSIGTDIISVNRVKSKIESDDGFKDSIFTQKEIKYCDDKVNSHCNYAGRFAAKEAFLKALGCGLRDGMKFTDIEIENNNLGKPVIHIYNKVLEKSNNIGISNISISISHEREYATAVVLLELKKEKVGA